MTRLPVLVKGEFDRLSKYNLFTANFVVLVFWVLLVWFLAGEVLLEFIPTIFLMESIMMTILLVGATLFYEKKEHTINSVMVSPVSENEYLTAKVIVGALNALITVAFISAAVFIIKGVTYNYILLTPTVVLVTVVHTLIGIRLSYSSKDFTSLLVSFIVYACVFLLPSIFAAFGIISSDYAKYLIVLPPEAASIIIHAGFTSVPTWKILFGYGYLLVLSLLLYYLSVRPKFHEYLMKEMGV